jgi:hypothetical protein
MEQVFDAIKNKNLTELDFRVISEQDLRFLAKLISGDSEKAQIVKELIVNIPEYGRNFDWNIGSIFQHLEAGLIVDVLKSNKDTRLINSIGLAWALGEFKNTSRTIMDFLYSIVDKTTNSDAWWRAAFSLEKLGLEEAVNLLKMSLKGRSLQDLNFYLDHIDDKKSVISILVLSNVENIEQIVYPKIKSIFLKENNEATIINCCWLIGRLKLIDPEIYAKLLKLISHENYELKYYTFFALQNNATEFLRPVLEDSLKDADPLIRKMAARGLTSIGNEESLTLLNIALYKEEEENVVAELSRAIYHLKNPIDKELLLLEVRSYRNENGMISDESDKWYRDPSIYRIFSEAEDPENLCFSLIRERVDSLAVRNPVDLATGTGRMVWQIVDKLNFEGSPFALDASEQMCDFIEKTVRRERKFTNNIKVINSTIADAPQKINQKSTFVISSFGFPSRISDSKLCLEELRSVYELLDVGGLFFTIGWDETFNDELSRMWFKFIPDQIVAHDFEEWRRKRASLIASPRNSGLNWLKRGIAVPLQFSSLKEAAFVMGYLFGRDAAQYVINGGKTEWSMSLGITCNTKEELNKIIQSYERN